MEKRAPSVVLTVELGKRKGAMTTTAEYSCIIVVLSGVCANVCFSPVFSIGHERKKQGYHWCVVAQRYDIYHE